MSTGRARVLVGMVLAALVVVQSLPAAAAAAAPLADVYKPSGSGPWPAVVLFHGGGFTSGSRTSAPFPELAKKLAAAGILAVSVDYRLNMPYPAAHSDARDALAWVKSRSDVDASRVATLGWSAGGTLAGWTAYRDGARAAVVVAGITDFDTFQLCSNCAPMPTAAGVLPWVTPDDPQTLLVYSTSDSVVPSSQGDLLSAALRTAGVPHTYTRLSGVAHADILATSIPAIVSWLVARLTAPASGPVLVTAQDKSVTEPDTGTTVWPAVVLKLSKAAPSAVSVTWRAAGGTATAGADYKAVSGTAVIPAGTTSFVAGHVPILGDTIREPNETVAVTITAVTGASLGTNTAKITIVDND